MGHNNVVSGNKKSMIFPQVDGWSTDPRVLGCHSKSPVFHVKP